MHEFAVASEIVDQVLHSARKNQGKKILSIRLAIGELTLLNTEQLHFWVRELFKGSIAEDAEIEIHLIRARVSCGRCGYRGGIPSPQDQAMSHQILPHCPRCHSFQIEIKKGRECLLKGIRVLREQVRSL